MATATRLYLVTQGDTKQLVEAASQAQARNHVIKDKITVTVPSAKEVADLMAGGAEVSKAE